MAIRVQRDGSIDDSQPKAGDVFGMCCTDCRRLSSGLASTTLRSSIYSVVTHLPSIHRTEAHNQRMHDERRWLVEAVWLNWFSAVA